MILYHGSYASVKKPDISFSRDNVDFGKGFYTTPIREQAISWVLRFKRKRGQSVVSMYELNDAVIKEGASILSFDTYSDEWLDCILSYRRGENLEKSFDIIIGGVANDKVFDTVELFFDGLIDRAEALKRLRFELPNMQYCFRSQSIIDRYLRFISSEVV